MRLIRACPMTNGVALVNSLNSSCLIFQSYWKENKPGNMVLGNRGEITLKKSLSLYSKLIDLYELSLAMMAEGLPRSRHSIKGKYYH